MSHADTVAHRGAKPRHPRSRLSGGRPGRRYCACLLLLLAAVAPAFAQTVIVELPATADASLYEESGDNANGAGEFLFAGRIDGDARRRALLRFDIAAAVPEGARVTSVQLLLAMNRTIAGAVPMQLRRVLAPWGEGPSDAGSPGGQGTAAQAGDATWQWRVFPDQAWATPGGDFSTTVSDSTDVDNVGTYAWDGAGLVADVQAWLDAPAVNHGWIVLADESLGGPTAKRFASRENSDPSARPLLQISYLPGASAPPPIASPTAIPALDGSTIALLALLLAALAARRLR